MAIGEAAHRNHEELFPNHKSTLKVTDPELIDIFDNFAFDEVIAQTRLDTKTRILVTLAAIIGAYGISELKLMVGAALNVGLTPIEILIALGGADAQVKGHVRGNLSVGNGRDVLIDVITQLLPWVGYPRTLNALNAVNEVIPER